MSENQINYIVKKLRLLFFTFIALSVIVVITGESWWRFQGFLEDSHLAEFILQMIFTLLTLGIVYGGLRMFSLKAVEKKIYHSDISCYFKLSIIRICTMGGIMLLDTLLYYAFMWAGFGYLAIILLISMFFVWPSTARVEQECRQEEKQN